MAGATDGNEKYLVKVDGLKVHYPITAGLTRKVTAHVKAVDGVSFRIKRGTTMALVGESGCGKSTTGRSILRLTPKTAGEVEVCGTDIYAIGRSELRTLRPKAQIIFQDPYSSLSPRLPVGEIIGEAVREHGIVPKEGYEDHLNEVMEACGLRTFHKRRYPHEFSGGQRQRVCIARAIALNPEFIVCDEPVSALDVSVQAQIINLLMDLRDRNSLTYLFISHDLSIVEHISDTVAVMYLGGIVEYAETDEIFRNPIHPYTKALFSANPLPDPDIKADRIILTGQIPSPINPPPGCKFHTRCPYAEDRCSREVPEYKEEAPGHFAACLKA
ncbi:MAG: ATP-binding cassette domain-containing protein [Oscillospiraceae bacterium]|nr:ATP-binding cassette domain-containing protein [Oscillospiraceae bacterium]